MISAKEAFSLTLKSRKELLLKEQMSVQDKIMESAKNGDYGVLIESTLHEDTINLLSKLGYRVDQSKKDNHHYVQISWISSEMINEIFKP